MTAVATQSPVDLSPHTAVSGNNVLVQITTETIEMTNHFSAQIGYDVAIA